MPRDLEERTVTVTKSRNKKKPNPLPPVSTSTTTLTNATATTTNSSSLQGHNAGFTEDDFKTLAKNDHGRYMPNSRKVGHAVLLEEQGKMLAKQYPLPEISGGEMITEPETSFTTIVPEVRPLVNIEAIEPFPGMHRYRAQTPNGTEMFAKRSVKGQIGNVETEESTEIEIACFSPNPRKGKPVFWGSIKPTHLLKETLSSDMVLDLDEMGQTVKGGKTLQVEAASVRQRTVMKSRNPDQNTVMGESAKEAYENFYEKMKDVLHPDMKMRLSRAYNAHLHGMLGENNFRPEWLHLYGWKLAPMSTNPQTQENLGAGPKWANTEMMLLEGVIKFFALHCPESIGVIKPTFFMLLDSELVERIDFEVKAQIKENYIQLEQLIDPFLKCPIFPKSSDLAQMAGVAYDILHDIPPVSTHEVIQPTKPVTRRQAALHQTRASTVATTASMATSSTSASVEKQTTPIKRKRYENEGADLAEKHRPLVPQKPLLQTQQRVDSSRVTDEVSDAEIGLPASQYNALLNKLDADLRRKYENSFSEETGSAFKAKRPPAKQQFPTQQKYQKSVVQVYTDMFTPNYDTPWQAPDTSACSGSGVVIENSGKKYILTNAHVAHNAKFMQVRLANSRQQKYEAKAKVVAYQCDLALLEIDDPEFSQLAEPAHLGEMVNLTQEVMTVGFPMGGTEMSISTGIVSRIQVDDYCMSGQALLHVGVDAAVNHGNSGGPVFSGNNVVGIAFQGWDLQGLGFMIPIPVVRRFLAEAFSNQKYRGFPTLAFDTESLENPYERQYLGMGSDRVGVLITRIDTLCDAYSKLKQNDVLLAIDGMPISNQGTVDIPDIGNCIAMNHVTQMKRLGETVKLKILRRNDNTKQNNLLEIEVVLDTTLGDTQKVGLPEYDKMPTYYINSGICFTPLTRNYMEGAGCEFEDMWVMEEGCALPNVSKKNAYEQVIVISHIIDCKETKGYDKHLNDIVEAVNGKSIRNLRDVILAMEGNTEPNQIITFSEKTNIVVPTMSESQLKKLLKHHHIPAACSEDLEDLVVNRTVVEMPKIKIAANLPTLEGDETLQSLVRRDSVELALSRGSLTTKKTRLILESASSQEDEESSSESVEDRSMALTADMLPGLKRYNAKLDAMEKHYAALPPQDDEEDEDDEDYDDALDDEDDQEAIDLDDLDEDEEEDDTEEEVQQVRRVVAPILHRHNAMARHGFFNQPSTKRNKDEDAPDLSASYARSRHYK